MNGLINALTSNPELAMFVVAILILVALYVGLIIFLSIWPPKSKEQIAADETLFERIAVQYSPTGRREDCVFQSAAQHERWLEDGAPGAPRDREDEPHFELISAWVKKHPDK